MERTLPQDHEDRIAGKGFNSLSHYNLVHMFMPMPQPMKIPDAKAAVDKNEKSTKKCQHGQMTKVKREKEVIKEAQREQRAVHFAALMDICHLRGDR